ncbi:MAG: hypothetical protein ACK53Y_22600, partial [bacterium]
MEPLLVVLPSAGRRGDRCARGSSRQLNTFNIQFFFITHPPTRGSLALFGKEFCWDAYWLSLEVDSGQPPGHLEPQAWWRFHPPTHV